MTNHFIGFELDKEELGPFNAMCFGLINGDNIFNEKVYSTPITSEPEALSYSARIFEVSDSVIIKIISMLYTVKHLIMSARKKHLIGWSLFCPMLVE